MRTGMHAVLVTAFALLPVLPMDQLVAQPATERPTITVTDFDFGTVEAQFAGDKKTRKQLQRMGVSDAAGFASALGTGAADLIVERLLATGAYRVLERKQLAAVQQEQQLAADTLRAAPARIAARYIVSGSVTRLGFNDKQFGAAAGAIVSGIYGLGAKKNMTTVHLTARVIDTETGEIVASFTGQGQSDRGWGLVVFGAGNWGAGGGGGGSTNIRETAIGEATERAAAGIVEQIVAFTQPQSTN